MTTNSNKVTEKINEKEKEITISTEANTFSPLKQTSDEVFSGKPSTRGSAFGIGKSKYHTLRTDRDKKIQSTPSQFFKADKNILERNNTQKRNLIAERAYEKGALKTHIDFKEKVVIPEETKYHIKVKSQIEKTKDYEKLNSEKRILENSNPIKEYNPLSKKSMNVKFCFDSSSIKGCMNHDYSEKINIKNSGYDNNKFNSKNTGYNGSIPDGNSKISNIPVSVLVSSTKEVNRRGNLTLNSFGMKMSLKGGEEK